MIFQNYVQTSLILSEILVIQSAPKIGYALFDPLSYEANEVIKKHELRSSLDKIEHLEQKSSSSQESTKKPCQGYDYNESICKYVHNRLLCGYNKNIGEYKNYDEVSELSNGCRIRGDRLECGYIIGPFNNPRRPPADYTNAQQSKRSVTAVTNDEFSQVRLKHNAISTTIFYLTSGDTADTKQPTYSKPPSPKTVSITVTKLMTTIPSTIKLTTESTTKTTTTSTIKLTTKSTTKKTTTSTISTPKPTFGTTKRINSISTTSKPTRKRTGRKCVEIQDRIVCYN